MGKFSFLLSKLKVIDGVKTNSYTFFISFRKLTLYQTRFLSKLEEKKMKNIKDPSLTCLKVEKKNWTVENLKVKTNNTKFLLAVYWIIFILRNYAQAALSQPKEL